MILVDTVTTMALMTNDGEFRKIFFFSY